MEGASYCEKLQANAFQARTTIKPLEFIETSCEKNDLTQGSWLHGCFWECEHAMKENDGGSTNENLKHFRNKLSTKVILSYTILDIFTLAPLVWFILHNSGRYLSYYVEPSSVNLFLEESFPLPLTIAIKSWNIYCRTRIKQQYLLFVNVCDDCLCTFVTDDT